MSVSYGKGDKGKATKLHAELVRSTGYCESCFKRPPEVQLQCAHIQGRKASATRTLLINAFCLCASCHRIYTDKPLNFARFVTGTWAQEYRDLLLTLSNTMTKKDWTAELARLKEVKQRLENGSTLEQERELEVREL
jgi:hypothetical protein